MEHDKTNKTAAMLHQVSKKWIVLFLAVMLGLSILSRFLDTIIVPQVTLDTPRMGALQFQVKGTGVLEAEEILTVPVLQGLNVRSMAASPGQTVQAGTPLFAYQMDELETLHDEKSRELQQLRLSLESEQLSAEPLPKLSAETLALQELAKAEVGLNRAREKQAKADQEYQIEVTILEAEFARNLEKTKEDLIKERKRTYEKAQNAYELALLNKRLETRAAAWAHDNAVLKLEQLEDEDASDIELREAELEAERADKNMEITREKWEFEVETAKNEMTDAYHDWQEMVNGGEDIVIPLKREYEKNVKAEQTKLEAAGDQVVAADDAYRDAQTALANARLTDSYDQKGVLQEQAIADIKQQSMMLDIAAMEAEVADLTELIDQNGMVNAPYNGTLIRMDFTTAPGSVLIGAGGILMRADIDDEQAKNLSADAAITLKKEGRRIEAQAAYRSLEHDQKNNNARFTATLTGTTLLPGSVIEFVCESKSEPYNLTIPLDALRQDNQSKYVLLAEEHSTILGKELRAVRRDVTVIAKSPERVAIEGGISNQDRLIIGSTRHIETGARVRGVTE